MVAESLGEHHVVRPDESPALNGSPYTVCRSHILNTWGPRSSEPGTSRTDDGGKMSQVWEFGQNVTTRRVGPPALVVPTCLVVVVLESASSPRLRPWVVCSGSGEDPRSHRVLSVGSSESRRDGCGPGRPPTPSTCRPVNVHNPNCVTPHSRRDRWGRDVPTLGVRPPSLGVLPLSGRGARGRIQSRGSGPNDGNFGRRTGDTTQSSWLTFGAKRASNGNPRSPAVEWRDSGSRIDNFPQCHGWKVRSSSPLSDLRHTTAVVHPTFQNTKSFGTRSKVGP